MKFKATPEQIKQIFVNAINASKPVGMGFLSFKSREYTTADLEGLDTDQTMDADYIDGRMVKLCIFPKGGNTWETIDQASPDYQSWANTYTPQSLVESVGAVVVEASKY